MTEVLASARTEAALLQHACEVVTERGGFPLAWIGRAVQENGMQTVRPVASAGREKDYLNGVRISWDSQPTGCGPVGSAIRTGKAVVEPGIRTSERFLPWREAALQRGFESCIALPLRWRAADYGVLVIYATDPNAFPAEEFEALSELADKISAGIYFHRLAFAHRAAETELRNEKEAQEALGRILGITLRPLSLEEKLDEVLDILFGVSWLRIEHKGAIFLAEGNELRLAARRHLSPELHELCDRVPFGQCLCGAAAAVGEPLFRSHLEPEHEIRFHGIADHGHYCYPILSNDGVLGVLNLYVAAGHQETTAESHFLRAVADTLAGVIEREKTDRERYRLASVVEASPDFIAIGDIDGEPTYFNETARDLVGCGSDIHADGCRLERIFPGPAGEALRNEGIPTALRDGVWKGESLLRTGEGREIPVSQVIIAPRDEHGVPAFLATICRDISDRKRLEAAADAMAVREKQFANAVINSLPEIFFLLDGSGRLRRWNDNFQRELGYPAETLDRMRLVEITVEEDREAFQAALTTALEAGISIEVALRTADGQSRPYIINAMPIAEIEKSQATVVGVGVDISERKALEAELERRASYDFLTGLFNRQRFTERLQTELARADRYGRPISLMLLDIDYFKAINDTHGHDVGDQALKHVASRMRKELRSADTLGRWGGEEFVVLAPEARIEDAVGLAEKLRSALASEPVEPVGIITASFGVAEYRPGEGADSLLKRADDALYRAKRTGRNRVCRD